MSSSWHDSLKDLIDLEMQWVVCVYLVSVWGVMFTLGAPFQSSYLRTYLRTIIHFSNLWLLLCSLFEGTCLLQTIFFCLLWFWFLNLFFFTFLLFLYKVNWNWFREPFKEHFSSSDFTSLWLKTTVEQWRKSKHFGLYSNNYHLKIFRIIINSKKLQMLSGYTA